MINGPRKEVIRSEHKVWGINSAASRPREATFRFIIKLNEAFDATVG